MSEADSKKAMTPAPTVDEMSPPGLSIQRLPLPATPLKGKQRRATTFESFNEQNKTKRGKYCDCQPDP